jgi:hypothetical protein
MGNDPAELYNAVHLGGRRTGCLAFRQATTKQRRNTCDRHRWATWRRGALWYASYSWPLPAIERGDPVAASLLGGTLRAARDAGFVTCAPQVTSYLIEHSTQLRPDPFVKQLITAALEVHATQRGLL